MYKLTDLSVKRAQPCNRMVKLTDGHGLYLQINPSGGKLWRFTYRFDGKQKLMALGSYPEISLGQAREKHLAARKMVMSGVDSNGGKEICSIGANCQTDDLRTSVSQMVRQLGGGEG